jgi:cell division septum initiation protein DivIVA
LHAVFGYNRAQVDTYVDDLRHRLATMRLRARRAETELKKLRASHPMAGGPIGSP